MNSELARAFDRIADLLEIAGGDTFRVNSYRRVSRIITDLADDIRVLHEAGVIRELAGIGKGTTAKIEEFLKTGTIGFLEELSREVPSGLLRLLDIPGVGPKTIALVHARLDVACIDDLRKAIETGALQTLPGMGAQSAKRITEGIAFLESSGGRTPRGMAVPVAEELAQALRKLAGVERVEIAGSIRRGLETVGDVDLVCSSTVAQPVIEAFLAHPLVRTVLASGKTKCSVTVGLKKDRELQVDLRVVPAESFGAALQHFTGSKEHNVRLREVAAGKGWKLNEWGLFAGEKPVAGAREEDIYRSLDLPLIPAEVREDRAEFDDGTAFDDLISLGDVRGDLHMHTTASDGVNTIAEMAAAARVRGYSYIAVTDHSASSRIANGLSAERLPKHIAAIREADAQIKGLTVLAGCECDIRADGSLDYPDDLLAECDLVIAAIHSGMGRGRGKMTPTERTLAAIENRFVGMIAHPTGRLIHQRPPMDIDMARIIEAAARTGTALEVNASWQRLDLKDVHVRQAVAAGVRIAIVSDAHGVDGLAAVADGVVTARRGYVRTGDVLNALPLAPLQRWLAGKRL